jgi:hypothetical protein
MGTTFDFVCPGKLEIGARPWGPDGAILCNSEATKFKLNFQYICRPETFEYGFSHTEFQIQKAEYAGFRWGRFAFPIRSEAAASMTTG